jgi:hypothetical protein
MRRSPALGLGPLAFAVLGAVAACEHAEPTAHNDAVAVAPPAGRSSTGSGPATGAEEPRTQSPQAARPDARPVAAVQGDPGDDGKGAAADGEVVHCLEDAGAPAGRTLIRFVNRRDPAGNAPAWCTPLQLVLEIPSLGVVRELCNSSCGPFHFDSQKKGPGAASFVCENDFYNKLGTATVVDGVLRFESHDNPVATPFHEGPVQPRPPVVVQPNTIALPCGARPDIQIAGPLSSTGGPKKSSL